MFFAPLILSPTLPRPLPQPALNIQLNTQRHPYFHMETQQQIALQQDPPGSIWRIN